MLLHQLGDYTIITWNVYIIGGLNKDIEILGRTKKLGTKRGKEIQDWLDENEDKNIESFVFLDDGMDMEHLTEYAVFTDVNIGLTYNTYYLAKQILEKVN